MSEIASPPAQSVAFALACTAFVACAHEHHPEYHPESRYSYVQNVTYAQNALILPAPAQVAPNADATYALAGDGACSPGRPAECWRDCFKRSSGTACHELASMYEAGYAVVRSHEHARELAARACELGECGPLRTAWRGEVTSPGAVIVYGDFKGSVLIGH